MPNSKTNVRKKAYVISPGEASQERTISYGELSSKLTSIRIGLHDSAMRAMLGQILGDEDACGRGMLSAS